MSWIVAARAINEGIKIKMDCNNWSDNCYIVYGKESDEWFDERGKVYNNPNFTAFKWEEYKEPKKLIKWYRAEVVWWNGASEPQYQVTYKFYKTKEDKGHGLIENAKVIKWQEIEAPETWEQCECD